MALESDSTLEGPQVAVAVMLAIAFSAVLAVVVAALCLLFAFKVRAGRNWARITLTVLTVFGVSFTAVDPSWPSLVSTLVAVVATVLMFLPNANAYFRGQRRPGG
nr:hypothetical protein GCM10020241_41160 [Streptoalloteichus tenebrarius]